MNKYYNVTRRIFDAAGNDFHYETIARDLFTEDEAIELAEDAIDGEYSVTNATNHIQFHEKNAVAGYGSFIMIGWTIKNQ